MNRLVASARAAVWVLVIVAACTTSTGSGEPGPEPSAANGAGSEAPVDLSARPLLWFTPQPYIRLSDFEGGSVDFFEVFEPKAAWAEAAERIHVFKLYDELGLDVPATDEQWRTAIDGVTSRGMTLAMELGPLPETEGCGGGEGFGYHHSLELVQKVRRLGGRVEVVVFDGPYAFGHFSEGPGTPCRWSLERIARESADFVSALREIEPDVVVGGLEPLWQGFTVDLFADWLDAYEAAAGEPLAFLHLDVDWSRPDWPERALEIERAARDRGVPFGMIYNGGDAESDQAWAAAAVDRMYTYEQVLGGRPDHVIVQSWHEHPSRVLPDDDPTSLTGLVLRYLAQRTSIEIDRVAAPRGGRLTMRGTVTSSAGAGVPAAPVSAVLHPRDGPPQALTLEGRVPRGATSAVVGLRVNVEGAGPGTADLKIYGVSYAEDGGGAVSLGAPTRWGADGDGLASAEPSDRGPGTMLRLVAKASEWISSNSPELPVSPGGRYRFTVEVAVPERSAGAAYAAVIFLGGGTETARDVLALEPAPVDLGTVSTDGTGAFEFGARGLHPGRYVVELSVPGDLTRWPARRESRAVVG